MVFCLMIFSMCFLELIVDKLIPKRVIVKMIHRMCGEWYEDRKREESPKSIGCKDKCKRISIFSRSSAFKE